MKYLIVGFLCLFATVVQADAPKSDEKSNNLVPRVELKTNLGKIVLELMPEQAPTSVENFLTYAQAGFYKNTIFHRVLSGFLIQGGGYDANSEAKPTRPPILNEANNGVKNLRGSVAMARLADPNSATSQFFINTSDNSFLDYSTTQPGYAVFGKVVEGMDIVDRIQTFPIKVIDNVGKNVPIDAVIIEDVKIENMPALKVPETNASKSAAVVEKPIEKPVEKPTEKPVSKSETSDVTPEKPAAEKKLAEPKAQDPSVEKIEVTSESDAVKMATQPEKKEGFIPAPDEPSTPDVALPMTR
jgi:cyclophilin family peptidyl-prolyl cis-trans isomerase